MVFFRAVVNEALGFAIAAIDLVLDKHFDGDADALLDLLAQPIGGIFHILFSGLRVALHQQGEVVHAALLREHALIARAQAVVFGDDLFELGREAVHAAQDDHVVIACGDAVQAAHGTCGAWQNAGEIVGAVANDRQRFFGQGGDDKLTIFTIRKRLESFWVHDFWVEVVFPYGQAVFGLHTFLSYARTHDLREAIDIGGIDAESFFKFMAHALGPWLGTEDTDAQ